MRFPDIVTTSLLGIKADKRGFFKIFLLLGAVFTLVICYTGVSVRFFAYKSSFNADHLNGCYLYEYYDDVIPLEVTEQDPVKKLFQDNKIIRNASCVSVFTAAEWTVKDDGMFLDNTGLCIDGTDHTVVKLSSFREDRSRSYKLKGARFDVGICKPEYNVFGTAKQALIVGRMPEAPGEIILDDYILSVFGIIARSGASESEGYADYQELLGKHLEITYSGETVSGSYVITGIFNSRLLDSREEYDYTDLFLQHIYLNPTGGDSKTLGIKEMTVRIYYPDYHTISDLAGLSVQMLKNAKTPAVSDNLGNQYGMTGKCVEYCVLVKLLNDSGRLIGLIGACMLLIILFTVLYEYHFFKARTEKFETMLRCVGMSRKDARAVELCRIAIMAVAAALCGTYFSFIILKILDYYRYMML